MAVDEPVAERPNPSGPRFRIGCWGDFSIVDCATGDQVRPRGRKPRALLAYLALHPGKSFSRERLTGLLWGDRAEEQARASLRQALVELRTFAIGPTPLLSVEREHVTLNPKALTTDIGQLDALAEQGDLAGLLASLPEGDERLFANLEGVDSDFDDWLVIERSHQLNHLATTIGKAVDLARTKGDLPTARSLELRLAAIDPDFLPARRAEKASENAGTGTQFATSEALQVPGRWSRAASFAAMSIVTALILALTALYVFIERPNAGPATIAVLPFKELSAGRDSYFAEGVTEEIMARLARDPGQKVTGRTSASSLRDQSLDAPAIGRKLNVSYLVEGTVRSAGEQVRVDVSLIRARDGSLIWTERFSGKLDDIFAFQDRIGAEVSRRISTGNIIPASRVARGDAYALYLTARGLVATRELAKTDTAIELLRQAVKLDPEYAPAWALLGKALIHRARPSPEALGDIQVPPEAVTAIQHALELQPDLAEAHIAYGMAAGPGNARRVHFERAAKLEPSNVEAWNALALDYRFAGEYRRELDAWRRAVDIEPLWPRAFFNASELAWSMGYRSEAERYSRRGATADPAPFQALMVTSDRAMRAGDFSSSLKAGSEARVTASGGLKFFGDLASARALRAMNYYREARPIWPFYTVDETVWRMWHNQAPTPDQMQLTFQEPASAWASDASISYRLATLLNAGRSREAARLFDVRFQSPRAMAERPPFGHAAFIRHSALVALAMRQSGRENEARKLLELANAAIRRTRAQGRVPNWYHALCAQLWAVAGRRGDALNALERAAQEGWLYSRERDSFTDLAIEPAFAPLRGNPRFERVHGKFRALIQKERSEARI